MSSSGSSNPGFGRRSTINKTERAVPPYPGRYPAHEGATLVSVSKDASKTHVERVRVFLGLTLTQFSKVLNADYRMARRWREGEMRISNRFMVRISHLQLLKGIGKFDRVRFISPGFAWKYWEDQGM